MKKYNIILVLSFFALSVSSTPICSINQELNKDTASKLNDFRSNNITNFDSLEKNSLDLYSSFKSIYLQDRSNKINNSPDDQDDWGNLEN